MVNALKGNILPLPAGKHSKLTKQSTPQCFQVNEGNSDLEAEEDWAWGALCSLRSKKKFLEQNRRETNFVSNEEKEQWTCSYVDRESTVVRK